MRIELSNVGKRFGLNWIVRKFNYSFESSKKYAITGHNGSGKSTLLKLISGGLELDEGEIIYYESEAVSEHNNALKLGYCAPYVSLIDELTLAEMIEFHFSFKNSIGSIDIADLPTILKLTGQEDKQIKNFSSGIKQCIKLALLFATEYKVLLLDEPTTNLDIERKQWYLSMMEQYALKRTVIIASNEKFEYNFVDEVLKVGD